MGRNEKSRQKANYAKELWRRIQFRLKLDGLPERILQIQWHCPYARAAAYAAMAWQTQEPDYIQRAQDELLSFKKHYKAYDVLSSEWPVFSLLQRFHEPYGDLSDVEYPEDVDREIETGLLS